jgi:hypothetical protein
VTITKAYSIHCDRCGNWQPVEWGESVTIARQRLAKIGWQMFRIRKGHIGDTCPYCLPMEGSNL